MITTVKPLLLGGWNRPCINSSISFMSSPSEICLTPFDDTAKKNPCDNRPRAPQNFSCFGNPAIPEIPGPVPARRSAVGIQARPHAYCVSARRRGFPRLPHHWSNGPSRLESCRDRRPTITRGLALSANFYKYNFSIVFSSNFNAKTE